MSLHDIIRFPHITEKSTQQSELSQGQVIALKVRPDCSKHQIREAVEKVFEVEVASVRTSRYQGKRKRQGRYEGRRAAWKKAYVTLKPGHKVEFFEGV